MGKPPFAGFLPLLWMLLFTGLFAFALAEEMPPLPPPVFVSTGLGGCLSACMQSGLGPSAVFL